MLSLLSVGFLPSIPYILLRGHKAGAGQGAGPGGTGPREHSGPKGKRGGKGKGKRASTVVFCWLFALCSVADLGCAAG